MQAYGGDQPYSETYWRPVLARITARTLVAEGSPTGLAGKHLYDWREQALTPAGLTEDAEPGRFGSYTPSPEVVRNPAIEINGRLAAVGSYALLRLRGVASGQALWEFDAGSGEAEAPGTLLGKVTAVSGTTPKVYTVRRQTRDGSNAIVDYAPAEDYPSCLSPVTLAVNDYVDLYPIPDHNPPWMWATLSRESASPRLGYVISAAVTTDTVSGITYQQYNHTVRPVTVLPGGKLSINFSQSYDKVYECEGLRIPDGTFVVVLELGGTDFAFPAGAARSDVPGYVTVGSQGFTGDKGTVGSWTSSYNPGPVEEGRFVGIRSNLADATLRTTTAYNHAYGVVGGNFNAGAGNGEGQHQVMIAVAGMTVPSIGSCAPVIVGGFNEDGTSVNTATVFASSVMCVFGKPVGNTPDEPLEGNDLRQCDHRYGISPGTVVNHGMLTTTVKEGMGEYLTTVGNLSGLTDAEAARGSLGLGTAAVHAHEEYQPAGSYQASGYYPTEAEMNAAIAAAMADHLAASNPHPQYVLV